MAGLLGRRKRGEARGEILAASQRALLQVLDSDYEGALESLRALARLDSEQIDAYLAVARIYRARGEIGRAIRVHQNLLLRSDLPSSRRRDALSGLAGDFRKGGFLQRAISAYEEVLAEDPRNAEAMCALVALSADSRDYERAIELRRKLAKRGTAGAGLPSEAELRVALAENAIAEGRSDDARRALRRALRADPKLAEGWEQLGNLEAERGRPKKALAAWRKVPELDRRRAVALYPRLHATFAALGRGDDYERFLRELLATLPEDAPARLALARLLAERGDVEAAAAEVRGVLERDPESLAAHGALVRTLLMAGPAGERDKATEELLDLLDRRGLLDAREDR